MQRDADTAYGSARRRLERMEYIATTSLLADFEEFVRTPVFAIRDALAAGSPSVMDLSELLMGVRRMEESLREAP